MYTILSKEQLFKSASALQDIKPLVVHECCGQF